MPISIRDIQQAQQAQLESREPNRTVVSGQLRSVNGTVIVPGRPNYVYFQEYSQPENAPPAVVWNDTVAPIADLGVLVASDPKPPFRRRVIGVDHEGLLPNENTPTSLFAVPLHAQTHQYPSEANPGHDKVLIFQPAIQPLKTTVTTGLEVQVHPLIYIYRNRRYTFAGNTLDLSSYVPSVGNIVAVLIYLDTATNTLQAVAGTSVINNGVIPIPYPDIPGDAIPSAYVLIVGGTTTLNNTDLLDARFLLWANYDYSNLTPRRIGDILISNDGVDFEPGETIVDMFGELVTDANGHLVVV